MATHNITVPLDERGPYERLYMHRGDSDRTVKVQLIHNSQPFTPPAGTTATFFARKPDGKKIAQDNAISISGSVATINLTANTLAAEGMVHCDIEMNYPSGSVGTAAFHIEVMKAAVTPADLASTDDWQIILEAIARAEAAAQNSANAASGASTAKAGAEAARNEAQAIKNSTEVQYDVQEFRVGFKRADEPEFKYTGILRGDDGFPLVPQGPDDPDYPAYREPGSSKPLPDLPAFSTTKPGDAFVVDDEAVDGQIDIYYNGGGSRSTWVVMHDVAGVPLGGDMTREKYANGPKSADGYVDKAVISDTVPWAGVTGKPSNMTQAQAEAGTSTTIQQVTAQRLRQAAIAAEGPGTIKLFAGTTAPAGFLLCQGQAVSRTTYAALYAVIGTRFGSGDGSTTFNVPDMRNKFPIGAGTLGDAGGSASVALTPANLPSIVWNTIQASGAGSENGLSGVTVGSLMTGPAYQPVPIKGRSGQELTASALNVTNPYLSLNYIIKT